MMNMREAAEDRISNLPDSLLHHIHSFLPIKDSARTSVISKRWNYIWTTVPALDFKSPYCSPLGMGCYYPALSSSKTDEFMDFVDGTLRRHISNIDKFFIHWHDHLNILRVHSWICTLTRGNVKELGLHVKELEIPPYISLLRVTCESLISLQLSNQPSNCIILKSVSFPRLKRLQLDGVEFHSGSWNEEPFSKSTVLEELTLNYCKFGMTNFCISIPTLKHLDISGWWGNDEIGSQLHVLEIDAPRLVTFAYLGYVPKEFVLYSSLALVEATVNVSTGEKGISQLLHALAHVKCLTVYGTTLQAIYSYGPSNNLLKFHNVKMLKISDTLMTTDQGVIALLKAVPNLESLVFVKHMNDEIEDSDEDDDSDDGDDDDGDDEIEESDEDDDSDDGDDDNDDHDADSVQGGEGDVDIMTIGCLLPNLKSVCFREFVGNQREVKWVRLILRDAEALQKMAIIYYDTPHRFVNAVSKRELKEEIPTFPRASPSCVIKFGGKD